MSTSETSRSRAALGADLISQRGFMVVRRGYDQDEVRAFLDQVAAEVRELTARVASLSSELAAAKKEAATAPAPVQAAPAAGPVERPPLDIDEVVALVGEETAAVLRAARAAAIDLRRRAEGEAERLVSEARQQSTEEREQAAAAVAQAEARAEALAEESRQGARTEADAIVARARADADAVREQAEQERRRTVDGAHALREKILADLSRRRRVATVQIEQLRAGRERLLESYAVVRRTLDEVHDELQRADAEARAAADDAGRRAESGAEPGAEPVDVAVPADVAAMPAEPVAPAPAPEPVAVEPEAAASGATQADEQLVAVEAPAEHEGVRILRAESGSAPHAPAEAAAAAEVVEAGEPAGEVVRSNADEAALQVRDRLVADAESTLVKRLKRLLQDEQNELLDRLRNAGPTSDLSGLLASDDEARAGLLAAVGGTLGEAATAGADAMGGEEVATDVVGAVAAELATAVLDPLRRRLAEVVRSSGGEQSAVIEAIGSVYREWKTQRVEPAAQDAVIAAYSAGAFESVAPGTALRWVVEDAGGPCADCDDNALAGALGRGEPWPTGQLHPPAHAGCRCLLVRA